MDTGAGSGTRSVWHGVTQAQEDWVGRVITLGWLQQLSVLESRHNVPEKGNRKCCVYSVPGQHTSAYCYPGFALHAAGLVYIPNLFRVTSTTNI